MKLKSVSRMVLVMVVLFITGALVNYTSQAQSKLTSSGDPVAVDTGATQNFLPPWPPRLQVQPSQPEVGGYFGHGVAIEGTTALVGQSAAYAGTQGKAFVYTFNGTAWVEQQVLVPSDGQNNDLFGYAVAVHDNMALVSAVDRQNQRGAVYVFKFNGTSWVQAQIITPADPHPGDQFGTVIGIDGNTAVIGAPAYWGSGPGAGYVFVFDGISWSQQAKLTASDGQNAHLLGYSGASVSGNRIIIGAPHAHPGQSGHAQAPGAAYVFVRNGTTWTQTQKLTGDLSNAEFGYSVAVAGDLALAGAIYESMVYAYQWNGSSFQKVQKFDYYGGTNPPANHRFGWSMDLEGAVALVGDIESDSSGYDVHLFRWNGTKWVVQIIMSQIVPGDRFGDTVALSGNRVIIGAPQDSSNGANAGAAYLQAFINIGRVELLANSSFETASTDSYTPDHWERIKPSDDIRKCNKPGKPHLAVDGQCVYQFTGGSGENSDLKQDIDLANFHVGLNDTLNITGFIDAQGTNINTRVRVLVKYDSLPSQKLVLQLNTPTEGWSAFTSMETLIVNGTPTVVRLIVNNQGTNGKIYYDAMSLQWFDTFTPVIPLPLAP